MRWGYIVAWRNNKGETFFDLFKSHKKATATFEDLRSRYVSVYMARLMRDDVQDGVKPEA